MTNLQIETQRLRIQPFCIDDAEDYFRMTRDKSIQKYLPYACHKSLEKAKKFVTHYANCANDSDNTNFYLCIKEKVSGKLIGTLFVTEDEQQRYHVNRMIASEARGNGYSIEALKGVLSILPKNRTLIFVIEKDNISSLTSLQKLDGIKKVTEETESLVYGCVYEGRKTFYYRT